jgi:hypothetical protein
LDTTLVELLEQRLVDAGAGKGVSTGDLTAAVQALYRLEEIDCPKWVCRARISKIEAQRRGEALKRAAKIFSVLNSTSAAAIENMRRLIEETRAAKTVYLPRDFQHE